MTVRELTGDMQLSKNELEETQSLRMEHDSAYLTARIELQNEICYKKVFESLRQGYQAMAFVQSRKDTTKTVQKLGDFEESDEKFLSRPTGGKYPTIEMPVQKRVTPPDRLGQESEYLSWLLSQEAEDEN